MVKVYMANTDTVVAFFDSVNDMWADEECKTAEFNTRTRRWEI